MERSLGTIRSCVSCGYDVEALSTRTCPECGYTATDEDVALAERRAWYLEATGWEVWVGTGVLVACAFLLSQALWNESGLVWFVVFSLVCGLAHGGGTWASRGMPRVHRKAFRRSWQMALPYWAGTAVVADVVWQVLRVESEIHRYIGFSSARVMGVAVGAEIVVLTLAVPLWYRCWRRAARLAGVPEQQRTRAKFRRGILFAVVPLAPFAAMLVLGLLVNAGMALLDRFFPGWEMGQ